MASHCIPERKQNVEPPELFRKSKGTDITLLISGKELHFGKYPLVQASVVFSRMIEESADQSKLQIDDVAYEDMIIFLECIHPQKLQAITDQNLVNILKIATKFQHEGILAKCEQYILHQFEAKCGTKDRMYEQYFFHLKSAEQFGLERVLNVGISSVRLEKAYFSSQRFAINFTPRNVTGYEHNEYFCGLSPETKMKILAQRVRALEKKTDRENPY
ncbi:hypothetical protein ACJMK2_011921 [Sinanodonta woodiana]|uniref:BTB domain-containing protein n=1 Tax=Sinanodonta woodiana TaxID=1069815 RepID=A0ABD3V6I4_SINWO